MSQRRLPDHGFTLLELMLAMTALALVAAICYGGFRLGIRAVEKGEVAVVTAQRLRVASDVLIRQLKSAVVYPARSEEDEDFPYFIGTATSLTFITAAGLTGGGGLVRVVYRVEDSPPRLVLEETPFFSPRTLGRDTLDQPADHSTVLLDGAEDLKFEYLFDDYSGDTEWRSSWDGRGDEESIPSAVRILGTGLPGLETGTWGQEIPIMVAAYGEGGNELSEDVLADMDDEGEGEDEDEETGAVQKTPSGRGLRGTFPPDDADYGDE